MSEFRTLSPRNYACYQGKTYTARELVRSSAVLLKDIETGDQIATVPMADLAEWYSVTVEGTFLEHDFQIAMESHDAYVLHMSSGDGRWAAKVWAEPDKYPDVVFNRPEMMVFEATVPKNMVTDLREERHDILGPWRQRQEEERRD